MSTQRFGEKLRTLRLRHGMTQRDLAAALGFASPAFIGFLENGRKKPSAELVLRLAQLFNVTMDQLMRDELEVEE